MSQCRVIGTPAMRVASPPRLFSQFWKSIVPGYGVSITNCANVRSACSASDAVAERQTGWLADGIHVTVPNNTIRDNFVGGNVNRLRAGAVLEMPGDSREATGASKEVMDFARRLRDEQQPVCQPDVRLHAPESMRQRVCKWPHMLVVIVRVRIVERLRGAEP